MRGWIDRRQMLLRASSGFGALVACGLLADRSMGDQRLAGHRQPHHPPRAKHVILCYMSGGVSHVDSFDPKPRLAEDAGKPMPMPVARTQFNQNGTIFPSPFTFERYGDSGLPISELFPHIARSADHLAVVRSMTSSVNEHAQGNFFFHTGFPFLGHASSGAWVNYGLGSPNHDLPGYVVLMSGVAQPPHGGVAQWGAGYLPAEHQASILRIDEPEPVSNLQTRQPPNIQRRQLEFITAVDQQFLPTTADDAAVSAAIQNYELAARMQVAVPQLCDLSNETAETQRLYGLESRNPHTAAYGRQCLMARRLVESGVRFVELTCLPQDARDGQAANPWDQHGDLAGGHRMMAQQVDQPIGGLLIDLDRRGLLDQTVVIWAGEFGRTPFSQGSNGRDHNPQGFSIWLAGGGTRGGSVLGATDEFGYQAIDSIQSVYDLWATVLHLLGLDHQRLTYHYAGRDVRLTDVHGEVMRELIV